ncbi:Cyclin-D2-1 [Quaeritorhiza haematococci]|nr:Cyclin-D2-1 [Quaeritorhiza haematococci]
MPKRGRTGSTDGPRKRLPVQLEPATKRGYTYVPFGEAEDDSRNIAAAPDQVLGLPNVSTSVQPYTYVQASSDPEQLKLPPIDVHRWTSSPSRIVLPPIMSVVTPRPSRSPPSGDDAFFAAYLTPLSPTKTVVVDPNRVSEGLMDREYVPTVPSSSQTSYGCVDFSQTYYASSSTTSIHEPPVAYQSGMKSPSPTPSEHPANMYNGPLPAAEIQCMKPFERPIETKPIEVIVIDDSDDDLEDSQTNLSTASDLSDTTAAFSKENTSEPDELFGSDTSSEGTATGRPPFKPRKQLSNLLESQAGHMPDPDYLRTKQESRWRQDARKDLVDFMFQLVEEYEYQGETLYIATNYLDRYFSKVKVCRNPQRFLAALGCLYVAGKFSEECREPLSGDFAHSAYMLNRFTKLSTKDIKRIERRVLAELEWKVVVTTPQAILHEILLAYESAQSPMTSKLVDAIMEEAEKYLTAATFDYSCIKYTPAVLAAASLLLVVDMDDPNCLIAEDDIIQALKFTTTDIELMRSCMERLKVLLPTNDS